MARIIILDDQVIILKVLENLLKNAGHETLVLADPEECLDKLRTEAYDLLISDIRMDPLDGMHILKAARQIAPSMPVILMTGYPSVETATKALKAGVFDYVTKPFKIDSFLEVITLALEHRRGLIDDGVPEISTDINFAFGQFIAAAPEMKELVEMIKRVAMTETKVLITGEFGTGRRSVAHAIHQCSNRKDKPFISLPCGELPEPILEALIIGSLSPASQKMVSRTKSLVDEAEGGTIFLEGLNTISTDLQEKLLTFFQGYKTGKSTDENDGSDKQPAASAGVRFIAGSTEAIKTSAENGDFEVDLYKQFASVELTIPPLRERKDDILPIAVYILKQALGEDAAIPDITPDARALLFSYPWPGNVSELATTILQAIPEITEGKITHDKLPEYMAEMSEHHPQPAITQNVFQGRELRKYLSRQITERQTAL